MWKQIIKIMWDVGRMPEKYPASQALTPTLAPIRFSLSACFCRQNFSLSLSMSLSLSLSYFPHLVSDSSP